MLRIKLVNTGGRLYYNKEKMRQLHVGCFIGRGLFWVVTSSNSSFGGKREQNLSCLCPVGDKLKEISQEGE